MHLDIPLNRLKFGQDDGDGINARVAGRLVGIDTLAANLFAQGQIEDLIVKPCDDGSYSVANGNRRLAAFRMMYGEDSDKPVGCTLHEVDCDKAFEFSLTTVVTAAQLHPVDQYEAFARLEERGKTQDEIARQYGMSEKEVRQALALGRLSPGIRDAWRKGEIKAEVAKAFTLALDHRTQDKLFGKLSKSGHLYEHLIRRELGVGDAEASSLLDFAGAEYRAAGGHAIEDLFGSSHVVSDPALLKQCADDKLKAACEALVADGWSWAAQGKDLPHGTFSWRSTQPKEILYEGDEEARLAKLKDDIKANTDQYDDPIDDQLDFRLTDEVLEIERDALGRSYSTKQKAKSGCIIAVEDGRLIIRFGVVKPEELGKASKGKPARDAGGNEVAVPEEPAISNALLQRLSVQLTEGAATALAQDVEMAVIVILARIASESDYAIKLSVSGLGASQLDLTGVGEVADNIELLRKMTPQERIALFAPVAAAALDFRGHSLATEPDRYDPVQAVCNAIDPAALNAALRGAFDAKDYFAGVNKALCLQALTEAGFTDVKLATKAELAAFAIANVPQTGWLPPQLRAKGYDGPPNAKPKATAPAASRTTKKQSAKAAPASSARRKPAKGVAKKAAKKKPAAKKRKAG